MKLEVNLEDWFPPTTPDPTPLPEPETYERPEIVLEGFDEGYFVDEEEAQPTPEPPEPPTISLDTEGGISRDESETYERSEITLEGYDEGYFVDESETLEPPTLSLEIEEDYLESRSFNPPTVLLEEYDTPEEGTLEDELETYELSEITLEGCEVNTEEGYLEPPTDEGTLVVEEEGSRESSDNTFGFKLSTVESQPFDISDEPRVGEIVPEPEELEPMRYGTLKDYLKANPGVLMSEAVTYFSKKEIEKGIRLGRVILRHGKLFL